MCCLLRTRLCQEQDYPWQKYHMCKWCSFFRMHSAIFMIIHSFFLLSSDFFLLIFLCLCEIPCWIFRRLLYPSQQTGATKRFIFKFLECVDRHFMSFLSCFFFLQVSWLYFYITKTCVCSFQVVSALFRLYCRWYIIFIHFWFFGVVFVVWFIVFCFGLVCFHAHVNLWHECRFQMHFKYAPEPIYFNVIGVNMIFFFWFVFMIK